MLVGGTGIEPATSSVSGTKSVLNTPPLSTKQSLDVPRYPPKFVAVVKQLVKHPNLRTPVDAHGNSHPRALPWALGSPWTSGGLHVTLETWLNTMRLLFVSAWPPTGRDCGA